jgi:protoporphyrinogen oxidase
MSILILGGGIAGLSVNAFLGVPATILEKESVLGGLCRSFDFEGIKYDIGPHIIFSKHQEVLEFHNSLAEMNTHKRLNRILLNGHLIRYPFENFLGEASEDDRNLALHEFLNNPYESFSAENMQQFFLKLFGEGMSTLYFHPYNKKIWKLDPSFLDLQMVERIPKPPRDHVVSGAHSNFYEGYTHQLTFTYPKEGGFQVVTDEYRNSVRKIGSRIVENCEILGLEKREKNWKVLTNKGIFEADKLISTIPLPRLIELISEVPIGIREQAREMLSNSIHIIMLKIRGDRLKDQFALYVPDPLVIFHRLSRLNFLGEAYGGGSNNLFLMAEITFRNNSYIGEMSSEEVIKNTIKDLEKLGIANREDIEQVEIRTFEHAYVIYDLKHRARTDEVLSWTSQMGIVCTGRFGKFEYQNSDQVVYDSMALAETLKKKWNLGG